MPYDCLFLVQSLGFRGLHCDTIYVYKMLFGLADLNVNEYFTLTVDGVTHGHEHKLFINFSRLNIWKHFLC